MRVFTATLGTETNTFSPLPTGMQTFRETFLHEAGQHPDRPSLFTAPLWAARQRAKERNWQVSEGLCAFAQPAGPTVRKVYEQLRDTILADLKRALPVDMVVLGMHGAMVAEGYDDCEGDLLARVREIVGPGVVVGAELDPHCHLTPLMTRSADVLVCFKEYPHTDALERGQELVDLCADAAMKKTRPVMATFDCRQFDIYMTPFQPMRDFVDRLKALEGKDGILSVSLAHGFPWGDVPEMGTKLLVVADGDRAKAQALADRLGAEVKAMRGQAAPKKLTIAEGLERAMAVKGGPVVIADNGDNAGGGAPSDSNFMLAEILRRGIADVAIGPYWDPIALRFCQEAGEGARLRLRVGGKCGPMSGDPLDLPVEVLKLKSGHDQEFGAVRAPVGDAALIRTARGVDLVLISVRGQALGSDLFSGLGCDLKAKKLIVVKSSQHFYASFSKLAKAVLYCDTPGAISTQWGSFDFRKVKRPIWPLDGNAE
ncbi:MAG: M81 family metallopeptidase [Alphaproteobacteria bacterium]|nr:M81 family metallopeptidase [Alphaproteobacteria bacterium]